MGTRQFSRRAAALLACGAAALGCSDDGAKGPAASSATGGAGGATSGGVTGAPGGTPASGGRGNGGAGGTASGGTTGGEATGGALGGGAGTTPEGGGAPDGGLFESLGNPWGLAPSASSSRAFKTWMPKIAASGAGWVRGFDVAQLESVLTTAAANGLQVSGILQWSPEGTPLSFPVNDIPGWKAHVTDLVRRSGDRVRYWEVWNEPPNFTALKTPDGYAAIVRAAYEAAKAVDPDVRIGLAAQSVNLNFLAQALDAGAAGHFDYVTVHPYETLGLVADGFEPQYLSIVPNIRKLLADKSPEQANVPVIITELGEPVQNGVTEAMQADTLVKAYVLSLSQGVARVHWFEPLDGDSGPFGVLHNDLGERPSYVALRSLIEALGEVPRYQGHVLLDGECCGFVFEADSTSTMVAWSRPGASWPLPLAQGSRMIQPKTGAGAESANVTLTNSPLILTRIPASLVAEARANAGRPMLWNGDFRGTTQITYSAASGEQGLHPLGKGRTVTVGGEVARDVSGGAALAFAVDPSFLSYSPARLRVTAVLRRNGADNAGFNLKYESATGYKGAGSWFTVPEGNDWVTQSWTLTDPQFVGKWGYHLAFDSDSTTYSKYSVRSVTIQKE